MTQYDNPYAQDPYGGGQPPKTSGLAIAAIICAIVLPPIGVILGIAAIVSIKSNEPHVKGLGMAFAALIIGIIMTIACAGCGYAAFWVSGKARQVMAAMTEWPGETMDAGYRSDYTGFREHLAPAAASATDEEIQSFLDTLEERYGQYVQTHTMAQGQAQPPTQPGQTSIPLPVQIEFANQTVDATFHFQMADQATGSMVFGYDEIVIHDPDQGDVTFPPSN